MCSQVASSRGLLLKYENHIKFSIGGLKCVSAANTSMATGMGWPFNRARAACDAQVTSGCVPILRFIRNTFGSVGGIWFVGICNFRENEVAGLVFVKMNILVKIVRVAPVTQKCRNV